MSKVSAEYFRAWRKAHPEYLIKDRERKKRRTKEQRRAERLRAAYRYAEKADPDPTNPIIAWARTEAERIISPDRRTLYTNQLYEEVVSEILLARVARMDHIATAKDWLRREHTWRIRHLTGVEEGLQPLLQPF